MRPRDKHHQLLCTAFGRTIASGFFFLGPLKKRYSSNWQYMNRMNCISKSLSKTEASTTITYLILMHIKQISASYNNTTPALSMVTVAIWCKNVAPRPYELLTRLLGPTKVVFLHLGSTKVYILSETIVWCCDVPSNGNRYWE